MHARHREALNLRERLRALPRPRARPDGWTDVQARLARARRGAAPTGPRGVVAAAASVRCVRPDCHAGASGDVRARAPGSSRPQLRRSTAEQALALDRVAHLRRSRRRSKSAGGHAASARRSSAPARRVPIDTLETQVQWLDHQLSRRRRRARAGLGRAALAGSRRSHEFAGAAALRRSAAHRHVKRRTDHAIHSNLTRGAAAWPAAVRCCLALARDAQAPARPRPGTRRSSRSSCRRARAAARRRGARRRRSQRASCYGDEVDGVMMPSCTAAAARRHARHQHRRRRRPRRGRRGGGRESRAARPKRPGCSRRATCWSRWTARRCAQPAIAAPSAQLVEYMRGVQPGQAVKVDYLRDGKKRSRR